MPTDEPDVPDRPRAGSARLRRSGRTLVRAGAVLTAVALVVTLLSGWATRSFIDHLQDNSAELLDGTATVPLSEGAERTLYVTGGLIAPGELVPTPVEQIRCTVTGPAGDPVDFVDRSADRVGIDMVAARIQVVGQFTAERTGDHVIECQGLGVVVAPEVNPVSALARLGGLALGSLGTILGLTMLLIGGVLLLFLRRGDTDTDEDVLADEDRPPAEGAEEWWEDETQPRQGDAAAAPATGQDPSDGTSPEAAADDDDYVELTEEELAAFSEEEIAELVASGALVFDDDVDELDDGAESDEVDDSHADGEAGRSTP